MLLRYLIMRILIMIPMAFVAIVIIFLCMRVLPGDPVILILGDVYTEEAYEALNVKLGFDQPLYLQFYEYITALLRGDMGRTLHTNMPVDVIIKRVLPYSLELAGAILVIGFTVGGFLGIWSAVSRRKFISEAVRMVYLLGISVPAFLISILFIIVFSLNLGWFPLHGAGDSLPERIHHLVLPAMAGAAPLAAIVAGVLRSYMVDILNSDYIRTARAKGLDEKTVVFKHALKNALIPLITIMGNAIPVLLAELVLIERIFNRPGLGKMLLDSMTGRDYPAVQSAMVIVVLTVLTVNLLVDLAYSMVDPRVKPGDLSGRA